MSQLAVCKTTVTTSCRQISGTAVSDRNIRAASGACRLPAKSFDSAPHVDLPPTANTRQIPLRGSGFGVKLAPAAPPGFCYGVWRIYDNSDRHTVYPETIRAGLLQALASQPWYDSLLMQRWCCTCERCTSLQLTLVTGLVQLVNWDLQQLLPYAHEMS